MKKSVLMVLALIGLTAASEIKSQSINYNGCNIHTATDPLTSSAVDLPDPQRSVFVDVCSAIPRFYNY